jgi:hypothetical protein
MACRIGNALKCYGGGLGKLHGEPASTEVVPELGRNSTSSGFCVVSLYLSGTL